MSALRDAPDAVTPTPADAGLAGESGAKLARHVRADRATVRVSVADDADAVVVPMAAFQLFTQVLGRMARGESVAIVPAEAAPDPRAAQRRALEELVAEGQALGLG